MNDDMTPAAREIQRLLRVYRITSTYIAIVLTIILILLYAKLY